MPHFFCANVLHPLAVQLPEDFVGALRQQQKAELLCTHMDAVRYSDACTTALSACLLM